MSTAPTPDQVLDCKGLLCPMPIVKLSKAFKELGAGMTLLLEATDPGSEPDMAAWSKRTGNEIVYRESENGVFKFWIKKTA